MFLLTRQFPLDVAGVDHITLDHVINLQLLNELLLEHSYDVFACCVLNAKVREPER